jgi:cysteinyl-tRNA synthetase
MKIYDSVKKDKVEFLPYNKRDVKIYSCGPTVYDDAHLGHARNSVVFDLLHRVLLANKYKVTFAKNFTDIDDKIIKKMNETDQSLEEITTHYIDSYKNDMKSLNILDNTIEPKATENIETMVSYIESLIAKDIGYIIDDGVYFDTTKDTSYGSLSHIQSEDETQNRVETNRQKRDPKDFVMWKFSKPNEPSYSASFGDGRPGWHIECSAMIDKYLAHDSSSEYTIDIHCGGADLLFPHHENEAAQSRCCSNRELSKYWMHNGFVNIDGQKMSKSLGNSFFLKDALNSYHGEVIRFYLSSSHYRANFNFNEEDLIASKKRLDKLIRVRKRVYKQKGSAVNKEFKSNILDALNDDLNISKALSIVDEFVSVANDTLDNDSKNKALKKEIISNLDFVSEVLGIGLCDAYEYFQFGIDDNTKNSIEELIAKRDEAKKAKEYTKADTIRDEILNMGVTIMDTPDGTLWEIK